MMRWIEEKMTLVSWEGIGGLGQMGRRNYPLGKARTWCGSRVLGWKLGRGAWGWSARQACVQASASSEPAWAASPAGQGAELEAAACSSYPATPRWGSSLL